MPNSDHKFRKVDPKDDIGGDVEGVMSTLISDHDLDKANSRDEIDDEKDELINQRVS